MTIVKSISLFFCEGSSDKQYDVLLTQEGDAYGVDAFYGRRGATLHPAPQGANLSLEEAEALFIKTVNGKTRKGYTVDPSANPRIVAAITTPEDTGLRPQLLNPISINEAQTFLDDPDYVLQQKFDGERLLITVTNHVVTAANRKGQRTSLPSPIEQAASDLPDLILDGELVSSQYFIFDILELRNNSLRTQQYANRLEALKRLQDTGALHWPLSFAPSFFGHDKNIALRNLRNAKAEGVVFKHLRAPYFPGQRGESQVKLKFWASCTCIVASINAKRSVALEMVNEHHSRVSVGNVTIKANQTIPAINSFVEVKYLYVTARPGGAHGGSLYQPELLDVRHDVDEANCSIDQLQIKNAISILS